MRLFQWLQQHKLFVHYMTIVIVIVGIMCLFKMQREARPNVDFNRVGVAAGFPGASPGDIEELVVDPIEEKIAEVDGVEEFRSVSYAGAGAISIKIDDEYPNVQDVIDEVRRKISEVKDLPVEVDDPIITEVKAINFPVLRMALYGQLTPFELKLEVEKLKDFLQRQAGVQSVSYSGLEDLQLKVLANPKKLSQNDLTLMEIMTSLQNWSKQRPGGLLENSLQTANLSVGEDYNEAEKFADFYIRSNDSLEGVKLSSVADIVYDTQNVQLKNIYGSDPATLVTIVKKPFADIVRTVDSLRESIKKYASNLNPKLKFKFYNDQSRIVRNRLSTVVSNALFGLFLVLVILVLFLDWRSAAVTTIGIPVAILGGIVIIYFTGSTLNSLVIVGMIIVLGMLVDDAIVVCENIYSYVEQGMGARQAAIKGVSEIAVPVIATVMTTVFAFFPILFMKGIMGQFISVIPMTVVAMLLVSLFEALIILPIHSEEIMKPKASNKSLFTGVEQSYRNYLKWSIRNRWWIVIFLAVFSVASLWQGKQLFSRFTLFPAVGLEGFNVRVELDKNVPLDKTTSVVGELADRLAEVSQDSFESSYSVIGQVTTGGASGSRQNGSHLGQLYVNFVSEQWFYDKEKQIMQDVRKVVKKFREEKKVNASVTLNRPGPPISKPIQIKVTSRDFEFGQKIIGQIKDKFKEIDGVVDLETDLDGDTRKYRFVIDNNFAVSEGINPLDISRTIFAASSGVRVSEILKNNEKVDILVGVSQKDGGLKVEEILKLKVLNKNRLPVPIESFVKVVEEKGPSSIQRFDGLRAITLFGEVDEKVVTGKEANAFIRPFLAELRSKNPTLKIEVGGGEKDRMEALADTGRLYLLALLLIFMTISLSFNSFLYPFLVLATIPMGLFGVVWALTTHGKPLSLMAIIGVVGLSGVVVNVSIILLSFVQEKLNAGENLHEAIINAGVRRLRPIVITTVTTLTGLAPMIYGIGGIDFFVQPLALVLGWGLLVATVLTIFALPALISLAPLKSKKAHDHGE